MRGKRCRERSQASQNRRHPLNTAQSRAAIRIFGVIVQVLSEFSVTVMEFTFNGNCTCTGVSNDSAVKNSPCWTVPKVTQYVGLAGAICTVMLGMACTA